MLFVEFAFVEADFCSIARLVSGLIVELEFGELTFCLIWVGEFYTVETSVGDRSWNQVEQHLRQRCESTFHVIL